MNIPLPPSVNGADRTPEGARLRVVPQFRFGRAVAGSDAIAVGSHTVQVPKTWEAKEARVGDVYVTFMHSGRTGELVVLVDTPQGVRQIDGYSRDFVDEVRRVKFGRRVEPVPVESAGSKTAPVTGAAGALQLSDDDAHGEADRIVGLSSELKTPSDAGTIETDRLVAVVDDLDGRAFSEVETDETARLLQIAAELDDGTSSGDSEVDRLARMADSLGDG